MNQRSSLPEMLAETAAIQSSSRVQDRRGLHFEKVVLSVVV